jgi:hypothetical protein
MAVLERPARLLFLIFLGVSVASAVIAFAVPAWFKAIVEFFPVRATVFLLSWGILAACCAFIWSLTRIRDPRRFLESLAKGILAMTIVFVGTPVLVLPRVRLDSAGLVVDPGGRPLLDSSSMSQASAIMFVGAMLALVMLGAMYIYVAVEERDGGPFGPR